LRVTRLKRYSKVVAAINIGKNDGIDSIDGTLRQSVRECRAESHRITP